MDTGLVSGAVPWADLTIAATQALIALALLFLTVQSRSIQLRVQRATKVQEWGARCIAALADVEQLYLLPPPPDATAIARREDELRRRLAALIDEGRTFFGNVDVDSFGTEKPEARRGFRPKILDPLVAAHRTVTRIPPTAWPNEAQGSRLESWRRYFVWLLQTEVSPEWLRKMEGRGGDPGDSISEHSRPPPEIA